jgi:predicted permease
MFADLLFRVRALFNRGAMERDLDDELRFHLERETEKLVTRGLTPADAARQAMLSFGGVNRIKDDARDARGIAFWDSLRQDIGYAWRGLRARPGFTAAVAIALAIGIGANATMFSIVDRLLFRSPPYLQDADRVHRVYLTATRVNGPSTFRTMEYSRYADLTRWTTSFDHTGVIGYRTMAVGSGEDTRDMTVAAMSATMFDFFAVHPVIGRLFGEGDDIPPSGSTVAVLAWGFWRSHFGGDTSVLNRQLRIGTRDYTIIGVAPPEFVGITESRAPALFVPVTSVAAQRNLIYARTYGWSWLEMFARRRPDVSAATADADLSTAYRRSWEAMVASRPAGATPTLAVAKPHAAVGSFHLSRGPEASSESKVFTWVLGVAGIVLLIACANVANLMLARAVTRKREVALRLALGVSRHRLLQQLATESALLACIGGSLGVVIAYGGSILMRPYVGIEDQRQPFMETRTLAFVVTATLLVAVATGLAPMLHALRADVNDALKAGARNVAGGRSPARTALLLVQGALSLVLLVGAGLFVRSLWNLRTMRMGYDVRPLVYAEAVLRGVKLNDDESAALARRMEEAAASTPGATGATLAASVPFWTNEGMGPPIVAGRDSLGRFGRFLLQAGSPSYFAVSGTRILAGRGFAATDRKEAQPVAVISQRMADVIWPGESPIGKVFRLLSDTTPAITVVGVAENMRARLIAEEDEIWYYLPFSQYRTPDPQVLIRVQGDPAKSVDLLRKRLLEVMPAGTYPTVTPIETLVRGQGRSWELGAKMFVAFASIALLLAAIGLYSVIAYSVAQRTRELGVRIALGATRADVMRLVVGGGVRFALVGIAIGSLIALWASRWIEPLLFNQAARDPVIIGAAATLLLVVAVIAAARPALRAASVNPSQVLQSD